MKLAQLIEESKGSAVFSMGDYDESLIGNTVQMPDSVTVPLNGLSPEDALARDWPDWQFCGDIESHVAAVMDMHIIVGLRAFDAFTGKLEKTQRAKDLDAREMPERLPVLMRGPISMKLAQLAEQAKEAIAAEEKR